MSCLLVGGHKGRFELYGRLECGIIITVFNKKSDVKDKTTKRFQYCRGRWRKVRSVIVVSSHK